MAIDEASLAQLGQWPWPRTRLADELPRRANDAMLAAYRAGDVARAHAHARQLCGAGAVCLVRALRIDGGAVRRCCSGTTTAGNPAGSRPRQTSSDYPACGSAYRAACEETARARGTQLDIISERARTVVTLNDGAALVCTRSGGKCVTLSSPGDTAVVTLGGMSRNPPGRGFSFAQFCSGDAGLCTPTSFAALSPLSPATSVAALCGR